MEIEKYLLPVVTAFLLSLFFVPLVRLLAIRFNVVDNPNARKVHREPIPLLGGLGIFFAFVSALLLFYRGTTDLNLLGVMCGAFLVVLLGFWDDYSGGITWKTKLTGQLIIAMFTVVLFGVRITVFNLEIINILATIFWLVFITNSMNLLDNMDGLSAGIAAIAAFFYALLAYFAGQYDLALFCIVLSVATAGFLKYNFSPASIFMGDMGSMFLGFTLGCIAVKLQVTELSSWYIIYNNQYFTQYPIYWQLKTFVTSAVPILVLGLPVFDTALVSILRTLNGLAISTPGRDHSSHRLMQLKGKIQRIIDRSILLFIRATGRRKKSQHHVLKGFAHTRTVLILYACSAILGSTALLLPHLSIKSALLVFFIVVIIAFFSASKLGEVLVYKK